MNLLDNWTMTSICTINRFIAQMPLVRTQMRQWFPVCSNMHGTCDPDETRAIQFLTALHLQIGVPHSNWNHSCSASHLMNSTENQLSSKWSGWIIRSYERNKMICKRNRWVHCCAKDKDKNIYCLQQFQLKVKQSQTTRPIQFERRI